MVREGDVMHVDDEGETGEADGQFRDDPGDIAKLRTRSAAGEMTPIGSVATFRDTMQETKDYGFGRLREAVAREFLGHREVVDLRWVRWAVVMGRFRTW